MSSLVPGGPSYSYDIPLDWYNTISDIAPGLIDVANTQNTTPTQDWITTISRAMSTVIMADAQRRVLNVQLERAKQGLPPMDSSQYGLGLSVGLSPTVERLVLFGGLALLAVFMFKRGR